MLSREDFLFTIGYDGESAIVDGKARSAYGKLGTMDLARKGLYRAAYSSALRSGKASEMEEFIAYFSALTGGAYRNSADMSRLFGVEEHPVKRALAL
ncbi:MAG: hypothetical protein JXA15_10345 [Spirochaetales bacterium]|nr:hypothetical protein [Spirochaetales bacterium]